MHVEIFVGVGEARDVMLSKVRKDGSASSYVVAKSASLETAAGAVSGSRLNWGSGR